MTAPPLVSVIITTHNRPKLLRRALESVSCQDYHPIELIVVDDCSAPGVEEVVESASPGATYIRNNRRLHLSASRNLGTSASSGELIAFLDDDDYWAPGKIRRQVETYLQNCDSGLIYCWSYIMDGGSTIGTRTPTLKGKILKDVLVGQPLGNGSTFLIPKRVLVEVGGFDIKLRRGVDGDIVRKIASRHNVNFCPELLVYYETAAPESKRITSTEKDSLRSAADAQIRRLDEYRRDFTLYPDKKLALYRSIVRDLLRGRRVDFALWGAKYMALLVMINTIGLVSGMQKRRDAE